MYDLPDQPAATAGQATPANPLEDAVIKAAVRDAIHHTHYRDDTPLPRYGDQLPVPQPGRPPMSQGATDASVLMLAGATATTMVGGTAAVLMYVSQYADPLVCGLVFGAPTALLLALARLVNRTRPAPDVHHHYTGPVHHDTRITHTRAVWSKTINRH